MTFYVYIYIQYSYTVSIRRLHITSYVKLYKYKDQELAEKGFNHSDDLGFNHQTLDLNMSAANAFAHIGSRIGSRISLDMLKNPCVGLCSVILLCKP